MAQPLDRTCDKRVRVSPVNLDAFVGNGPYKPPCRAIVKRNPTVLGFLDRADTFLQVWQRIGARQLAGRTVEHAVAAGSRKCDAASIIGNDTYAISAQVVLLCIAYDLLDLIAGDQLFSRKYADVK